jgi:DNA-binding transcriptional MerR regulator
MDNGPRYTIAELAEASAAALDALGIAARNGQVRDRPDVRTIRYYGTLGLIDPPAEMTGRTARYGTRHLLQVLAVKALQARGDSLAGAQRALVGASDAELRGAIGPGLPTILTAAPPPPSAPAKTSASAPEPAPASSSEPASAPASAPARRDAAQAAGRPFWRTLPAVPPAVPAEGDARHAGDAGDAADAGNLPRPFVAVPLDAGATLLLADATVGAIDTAALRAAAGPLLDYLAEAGLVPGPPHHQGDTP